MTDNIYECLVRVDAEHKWAWEDVRDFVQAEGWTMQGWLKYVLARERYRLQRKHGDMPSTVTALTEQGELHCPCGAVSCFQDYDFYAKERFEHCCPACNTHYTVWDGLARIKQGRPQK